MCPATLVFPTSHTQRRPLIKHALTLPRPLHIQNPKKPKADEGGVTGRKGASAMQPAANGVDCVKLTKGEVVDGARMNEAAFLRQEV